MIDQIHEAIDVACHLCWLAICLAAARLAWSVGPALAHMWEQWLQSGVAK